MRKIMNRISLWLVLLAVIAAAGAAIYLTRSTGGKIETTRQSIDPAMVKNITGMVRLCSLEIYEETGINDTINGKGLFAIQRLRGEVTFDVENMKVDSITPDSIVVHLPRERVELLESTERDSYRVVDVWNVANPLWSAQLTTAEENIIKSRAAARSRRLAYERGYVARARANAVESLRKTYSLLPEVKVTIVDDTPDGNR